MASSTLALPTAANDFRSDTVTLPTEPMLNAIKSSVAEFGDDVYSEDSPTNSLESYVGELTGLSNAVFVVSGTMGNQVAVRSHLIQPPYSVVCGRRSHFFGWECGMAAMLSQAHVISIQPRNRERAYITLEDILPHIVPDDGNLHRAPTKVIVLENTISGKVVPVEEIRKISEYARQRGIKVHLDGARLWNACHAGTDPTLPPKKYVPAVKEVLRAYCAVVDSVTLCFSKSLGAPSGSILLSNDSSFILRARHFRKAMGGGLRQAGVLTAPARVAVDQIFLSGLDLTHANLLAKRLEIRWGTMGGEIQPGLGQETNFVWLNLKAAGVKDEDFINIAKEEGVKVGSGGRIATHFQISKEAVLCLERAFERTLELGKSTLARRSSKSQKENNTSPQAAVLHWLFKDGFTIPPLPVYATLHLHKHSTYDSVWGRGMARDRESMLGAHQNIYCFWETEQNHFR